MVRFLARRLAAIPVTMLAVSFLVFIATELIPGDVARVVLGREASQASVDALRHQLRLDEPLMPRYLHWLGGFVTGDWGRSYTLGVDVRPLVIERLLDSATLALLAFVLLVVFSVKLHWLPSSAQAPPGADPLTSIRHLLLPAVCLVLLCTGYVARHVRASTAAVLASPFIRAMRVRGMSEAQLVRGHVLRNSLVPATSALAVQLQFLLAGLVTVELLFGYQGIGDLLLSSATCCCRRRPAAVVGDQQGRADPAGRRDRARRGGNGHLRRRRPGVRAARSARAGGEGAVNDITVDSAASVAAGPAVGGAPGRSAADPTHRRRRGSLDQRRLVRRPSFAVVDVLAVFPNLVAAVVVVALVGRSTTTLVLVIGTFFVPIVTRSVRAAVLVEWEKPYVEAARLRGEPFWSLLWREVLPNVTGTVLVEAPSSLGDAVFAASTLSFLGLGQPPGSPEWGASVADNRVFLQQGWWTVLFPALAVGSLVIGVALIADTLREQETRR
ncbi:ABC-type dipeptide/oligopeptide/nickel transport system, permease component [Frankia sp. CcI6]|uniref:ABC transporter permease subunit n=1 Tax=Frankia TaxID=1854 RepID=UPI0003D00702|nr:MULTISPECIES: ABC transporter permease subunit [Frankia]ETA03724.1 ABC-type dipeptide/oligopeptide/nickel transport system, permease component [Frankia sp. CcI6]OAA27275.1 peptide/nickel transport system permease protein [Frankia casuarinae]